MWQLPEIIVEGVRYHHTPKAGSQSSHITHLANAMALILGHGTMGAATMATTIDEDILRLYVTDEDQWFALLEKAEEQVMLALHASKY